MNDSAHDHCGWLVVGHGTRDPQGQAEFLSVVRQLAARITMPIAGAFLELAEPTIAQGLAELARRDARRVIVVPMLLFAAGHAKEDVPAEVARTAKELGMELAGQCAALELHPKLLELSRRRFRQAMGEADDPSDTLLLMVGRGGSDASALDKMRQYTAALSTSLAVRGETAFAAVASPSVDQALSSICERTDIQRFVVQPHLLFRGEVWESIETKVNDIARANPQQQWLLAGYLGDHPLLVEAVLENARRVS